MSVSPEISVSPVVADNSRDGQVGVQIQFIGNGLATIGETRKKECPVLPFRLAFAGERKR